MGAALVVGSPGAGRIDKTVILGSGYRLAALAALSVGGWFLYEELTDGNLHASGEEPIVLIERQLPDVIDHDLAYGSYRHPIRSSYMNWVLTTG